MLTRPKFKDCFLVEPVSPDKLFILTESHYWVLEGAAFHHLAPLLTGEYTALDIVQRLEDRVSAPQLFYALNHLEQRGWLTEAVENGLGAEASAFWYMLGVDAAKVPQRLATAGVEIVTVGEGEAGPLLGALDRLNLRHSAESDHAALRVVLTDDYLNPDIAFINQTALHNRRPWLLARLVGAQLWLGPLFQPGQTACWECLAQRLRHNRQVDAYIIRNSPHEDFIARPLAAAPMTTALGANLAATEIAKFLTQGQNRQLTNVLLTYNTVTGEIETHPVTRRPQCPMCGDPAAFRPNHPIQLVSRSKAFIGDGGHRHLSPEETFNRYQQHISPLTGVINWLQNITDDASGLAYSYVAGHNFALIQNSLYWLQRNLRFNTGGKGMTEMQAKVSAMGEAIERYSAVYRGDEAQIIASYHELAPQAVPMNDLINISEEQFATRDQFHATLQADSFQVVPKRFDPDQPIAWSPVWSLTADRERYVPSAHCYFGHPDTDRYFFCTGNSSGCAAGNNLEEAMLQALFELVERDSVAIWWYNRIQRPALDLASFKLTYLSMLQDYYTSLHREFWVLDITSDLGIPAFAAVSRRTDRPVEDIVLGFGCHFDPTIALLRAVTEMNQFLPLITRTRPDGSTLYGYPEGEAITWWQTATLANQPYLQPAAAPTRRLGDFTDRSSHDLKVDVETCVGILAEAGMETLVMDMTRPDIGMTVCRVIVPGLRHFWRRLGPGRLYTVPVKLGWLASPTPEEALNPYSVFF